MLEAMMDTMVWIYAVVAKVDTVHPLVPEDARTVLFEMEITSHFMFMRLTWYADRTTYYEGIPMEETASYTHKILHDIPRATKDAFAEIPPLTLEDVDY